ncbi:MAG: hypothetical protein HY817_00895 [Candidatus Abawacabacteria bacterium]|nr:hypothetical protein [Candidatus Abawacabacteria bacterium]
MHTSFSKAKLLLPIFGVLVLAACSLSPAVPTPPSPPVALPNILNNPLAGLPTNLPNSDLNSALQGLNALGQLGQAVGPDGTITNPSAVSGIVNSFEEFARAQAARDFQELESVDFPEGVPDSVKSFNYTNGKLSGASFQSMDPIDLRLTYLTMDTLKTVGDFYRSLAKTSAAGEWKVKGQANGSDKSHIELQKLQGTNDDRVFIEFEKQSGLTEINIRYYNYSR